MRIEEVDKKLCSILYLAQGNEGTRIFGQTLTKVKNNYFKLQSKSFGNTYQPLPYHILGVENLKI